MNKLSKGDLKAFWRKCFIFRERESNKIVILLSIFACLLLTIPMAMSSNSWDIQNVNVGEFGASSFVIGSGCGSSDFGLHGPISCACTGGGGGSGGGGSGSSGQPPSSSSYMDCYSSYFIHGGTISIQVSISSMGSTSCDRVYLCFSACRSSLGSTSSDYYFYKSSPTCVYSTGSYKMTFTPETGNYKNVLFNTEVANSYGSSEYAPSITYQHDFTVFPKVANPSIGYDGNNVIYLANINNSCSQHEFNAINQSKASDTVKYSGTLYNEEICNILGQGFKMEESWNYLNGVELLKISIWDSMIGLGEIEHHQLKCGQVACEPSSISTKVSTVNAESNMSETICDFPTSTCPNGLAINVSKAQTLSQSRELAEASVEFGAMSLAALAIPVAGVAISPILGATSLVLGIGSLLESCTSSTDTKGQGNSPIELTHCIDGGNGRANLFGSTDYICLSVPLYSTTPTFQVFMNTSDKYSLNYPLIPYTRSEASVNLSLSSVHANYITDENFKLCSGNEKYIYICNPSNGAVYMEPLKMEGTCGGFGFFADPGNPYNIFAKVGNGLIPIGNVGSGILAQNGDDVLNLK